MEKSRFKYNLCDDGVSFSVKVQETFKKVNRTNLASIMRVTDADEAFNRGIKRGNTTLATGDRPRFALMTTMPEENLHPDLIKMGDCRFKAVSGDMELWLDMTDEIETVFHPYGTSYRIKAKELHGIVFDILVCQAEGWGAVVRITIGNCSSTPVEIKTELDYGGLTLCERTYSANYCSPDTSMHGAGNKTTAFNDRAILSAEKIKEKAYVLTYPSTIPIFRDSRAVYSSVCFIENSSEYTQYLIAGHGDEEIDLVSAMKAAKPEDLIKESMEHYKRLLAGYSISTPEKVLDVGFKTAILNLEYDYTYPAWYEGVHWWSAYWANNYQISAAISLGQLERSKAALEFFTRFENGPGTIVFASGNSGDPIEDALPYYLYQLVQYYNFTGDADLCNCLWPQINRAIEHLLALRDSDNNYLLDWHMHCNGFLYQADHLGMPGDAASPSLMMAGMLERISEVALEIGQSKDWEKWKAISDKIYYSIKKYMWNDDKGVFYNHIDHQGIRHMAHFYTDMVFPVLYTSLDEKYVDAPCSYAR